jgi:hypothetical protein
VKLATKLTRSQEKLYTMKYSCDFFETYILFGEEVHY